MRSELPCNWAKSCRPPARNCLLPRKYVLSLSWAASRVNGKRPGQHHFIADFRGAEVDDNF